MHKKHSFQHYQGFYVKGIHLKFGSAPVGYILCFLSTGHNYTKDINCSLMFYFWQEH